MTETGINKVRPYHVISTELCETEDKVDALQNELIAHPEYATKGESR